MSDNSKIVQFFLNEIFKKDNVDPENLSYLIAPQFSYYLNLGERKTYEQYAARVRMLNSTATVTVDKPTSDDDTHFHCNYEVILPAPKHEEKAFGFSQIVIRNGLIHQIEINYLNNQEEFEEFQKAMEKSTTVFL